MTIRWIIFALAALAGFMAAGVAPLWAQDIQPLRVVVDSVVVVGNDRYSSNEIQRIAQLRRGEEVSGPDVQDAIRRLFGTGQFRDIRIRVTKNTPAVFFIEVTEQLIVSSYEFEGLEAFSSEVIVDSIGLFSGAPLDPAKLSEAKALTRVMLADEGFPEPRIDTTVVADPSGLDQIQVIFNVDQGPRLALARVEFDGNEVFTDGQLRGAMTTVEEGFFWFKPGELHREEYRKDLTQNLPGYYARFGYLDLEVLGDTIIIDTLTNKGRILIEVREGPQYFLRSFEVEGNTRFPTTQLEEYFRPIREGLLARADSMGSELPPFDQSALDEATGKLGDLYRDAGYLSARIQTDLQRSPPEEEGGQYTIDAKWFIMEGQPSYVRTVEIVGNDYTHDRIIRQVLLVFPGDVYSQQRLIQSIKNLQSLGYFETLPPNEAIEINPRDDGDIDVVFRVKEKQTGNINFGLSAAGATGLAGFIGYDQPNLFGQGKNGHFRWLFGRRTTDIELTYSDPEIFGTNKTATIGVQSSRDRFESFSLGTRRRTGGFLEVGFPLARLRSWRFFVGYSLFADEVSDIDSLVSPERRGLITQGTRSTITLRIVRDTRSGGLFPTGGSRYSGSFKHTGGLLGGDGDYQNWDFQTEWFVPVAQIGGGFDKNPIELVVGVSARVGLITGDNPFFTERFFVGGTQAGIQVRGYEEATITPVGHVPRGSPISDFDRVGQAFFSTTTQFGIKLTDNIYLSTFLDAGNNWRSSSDFNPSDLLMGAGVGASLVTPFGPIGLDYAYGFDRRDVLGRPDPGWRLHFRFGRIF